MIGDTTFLKELKQGDKVIYCVRDSTRYAEMIKEVEKITPKGFIKVNGILFNNSNGEPRGGNDYWCSCCIEKATPERIKAIQDGKFIADTLIQMHACEALTYEQAKAIRAALDIGTKTVKENSVKKPQVKQNEYDWNICYGDDCFYSFFSDGLREDAIFHSENKYDEITYDGIQSLAAAIVEEAQNYGDIDPDTLLDSEWDDIQIQLVEMLACYLGVNTDSVSST